MTPINPWIPSGSVALLIMTASCAASPRTSAPPPRLALPTEATTPCRLHRLPPHPTLADLEAGYVARGADLVACDAARRLAAGTLEAERALHDRWRAEGDDRARDR